MHDGKIYYIDIKKNTTTTNDLFFKIQFSQSINEMFISFILYKLMSVIVHRTFGCCFLKLGFAAT